MSGLLFRDDVEDVVDTRFELLHVPNAVAGRCMPFIRDRPDGGELQLASDDAVEGGRDE